MQSCLVDNAVRKLRQARAGIGDLMGAFNVFGVRRVRFPEGVLHQMVGFFDHHFAAVEGFHNLDRAA